MKYLALILLASCLGTPVEPPDDDKLPLGTWMYVKGQTQVWCEGQDPYYSDVGGNTLEVSDKYSDDNYASLSVDDEHLRTFNCVQKFDFYDNNNAISSKGLCGDRIWIYSSWIQLVSPRIIYVKRYYDATNPYDMDENMHCRIFEAGYLRPLDDVLDSRSDL